MMRIGIGYDVHPLTSRRKLILGGIEIPFHKGLSGYSDADVLIHAIIDALLGAATLGDIGSHFPPGDPRYKNISSLILLHNVRTMLKSHQWKINNIDTTIVAQMPSLSPFISKMQETLSQTLNINQDQVSIKAATTEGLGFIGKGEGIAAYAIAAIEKCGESK